MLDYAKDDVTRGPVKFDVILDIGGGLPVAALRRILAPEGRLVFVGDEASGDWFGFFIRPLGALLRAPFTKQRFVMLLPKEHFSGLERLAAFVEAGKLRPVIDRRIPLEGVAQALRDLEAGKVKGKVLVKVA